MHHEWQHAGRQSTDFPHWVIHFICTECGAVCEVIREWHQQNNPPLQTEYETVPVTCEEFTVQHIMES